MKSKYAYVKKYLQSHSILPQTYIVIRVDGRGFSKFTDIHGYTKPNDEKGLRVMNRAAAFVMAGHKDI